MSNKWKDMYEDMDETTEHVYKPNHYSMWLMEPIEFIMRNEMEYWRGNLIKYAARAGHKKYDGMDLHDSEITDLNKIIRYCQMRINLLEDKDEL